MLKKLLASALAVATVASCAYVPSALASAATTYKTATAVDYADWCLKNPSVDTKETATIFVASNVAAESGTYTLKVAAADNNAEYVKANIKDAKRADSHKLPTINPDSTDAQRYVIDYLASAGNGNYVAQVNKQVAVVYSTWNDRATGTGAVTAVANTNSDTLAKADLQLLGYYNVVAGTANVDRNTVLAAMTQTQYTSQVKLASQEFAYWELVQATGTNSAVVIPKYRPVAAGSYYYTPAQLWYAQSGKATAAELTTGLYWNDANKTVSGVTVYLPTNDQTNWATYINNFWKYNNISGYVVNDNSTTPVAYEQVGNRYVKTVDGVAQFAAIFNKKGVGDGKDVNYMLQLWDLSKNVPITQEWTANEDVADYYYTTDPAEIYKIVKGAIPTADGEAKATLTDYLNQWKDATVNPRYYTLTDKYAMVQTDTYSHFVKVKVYVERAEKYTVYSYGDNTVKETSAWLTDAQVETVKYANQDLTEQLVGTKTVLKASAAELGVATEAVIDGVPATYAYAQQLNGVNVINTTYKMGDATVALSDFQTATGAFNSEAYFCRDAKVGDQVTLKVSLSDAGVAKKLDLTKLDVTYSVVGATVVKTNYDYAATEFPAGEAIDIALGQGTNIVTATVSYNGVKIGTFEPFYAYVG